MWGEYTFNSVVSRTALMPLIQGAYFFIRGAYLFYPPGDKIAMPLQREGPSSEVPRRAIAKPMQRSVCVASAS